MPVWVSLVVKSPANKVVSSRKRRIELELEPVADGLLCRTQRDRRSPREGPRPLQRLGVHVVGRHHPVGQTDPQCLLCRTVRPEKTRSLAREGPISRVRRCVPPAPGSARAGSPAAPVEHRRR